MSILNRPEFSSAYFFPVTNRCESVVEVNMGDAILRCHYHRPNANGPTLIHFHGNGEAVEPYVTGKFPDLVEQTTRGMNTLMIEYRGYGGSTGTAELVSMLPDGENVLKALNIDPARSIAYGRSIGSLYAIELASRCPTLAGLVIDSGIADIRKPFLEAPNAPRIIEELGVHEVQSEIDAWFNHQEKISRYAGQLLLLHAKHDRLIDVEHAYSLHRWATSATKELRVYDKGDHNTIFPINHYDMMESLSWMAEKLFPECTMPMPESIRYVRLDSEIGVEVGCPIENAQRYEELLRQRESEQQAIKERGPTEEEKAVVAAIERMKQRRMNESEVLLRKPSRPIVDRIANWFRL